VRVYNFSEARQKLAELLDLAKREDVVIKRRGGDEFVLSCKKPVISPFDVPGIESAGVTSDDIVEAVRTSRSQPWRSTK